ncbi:MAG TPA: amidohydrolase family protein [Bryobacteraceae bacterium]|nr:amidohydrolase family protein [Bryobacteraceae bacterium]
MRQLSRRTLLGMTCAAMASRAADESIIDIHQHTNYSGRTDAQLVTHQRAMGVAKSVLLPAGSKYGLAADAGGNDTVLELARKYPKEYVFFANELPDIPETRKVIEQYLKLGAIGIGEQKFAMDCDSKHMRLIADIAKDYKVPVLMHFQHETYNFHIERFHKMLEAYPTVNFIGHAQTWWGNIDKNHSQPVMYPKGPVTPGGITDRLLTNYPNIFGDLSAGSGLNALLRDEAHAREFLKRHQDRMLYGSDCSDRTGEGKPCSGAEQLAAVRRLSPSAEATRKMLHGNAARLFKLT